MPYTRAVLWFRNDLRIRDNPIFHFKEVREVSETLGVYCLDPRHLAQSPWGKHCRLGPHRGRFLAETVAELASSLGALGVSLLVLCARPEDVLPSLLKAGDVLSYQQEDTSEEQHVENAVLKELPAGVVVKTHWGHTLYHRDDLGWDPRESLPIPFGKFKFGVCDKIAVRPELPHPSRGDIPASPNRDELKHIPHVVSSDADSIHHAMHCDQCPCLYTDQAPAIPWRGGENAALARLVEYATASGLGMYHRTRNQLYGANTCSHLSPWLSNGSLSPRTVYWQVKSCERSQAGGAGGVGFDHIYKFVFELTWRDYFRFYCAHFGSRVFFLGGPAARSRPWRRDIEAEERWKQGKTGVPLVDALMRELLATGYIANRGRYIVASYLVHYLGIDWRVGADWFERLLLDHDVCSNYGEWASMAGVAAAPSRGQPLGLKGRGPTSGRSSGARGSAGNPWAKGTSTGDAIFDPWEQGKQYDRSEMYVRRWVPELRQVPPGQAHWPHDLDATSRGGYTQPLATEPFAYDTIQRQALLPAQHEAPDLPPHYQNKSVQGQARLAYSYTEKSSVERPFVRRWKAKGVSGAIPDVGDKRVGG